MVKKSYKSLFFLIRNVSNFTNIRLLFNLYCMYVRSNLEYACVIWYPITYSTINDIEKLQKVFIRWIYKKITGIYPKYPFKISYYDQMQHINNIDELTILTLAKRRDHTLAKEMHKLLHCKLDATHLLELVRMRVPLAHLRSKPRPVFVEYQHQSPITHLAFVTNRLILCDEIDIFNDHLFIHMS